MGVEGEDLCLCVEMPNVRHPHTTHHSTEGSVVEGLELLNIGLGGVGEPYWGSIGEKGSNEGYESDTEGFLLLAPIGASEGSEEVKAGRHAGDER